MKKKLVFLLIAVFMMMLFTACGSTENTEQPGNDVSNEKQEEIPAIDESQEEPEATPTHRIRGTYFCESQAAVG